MTPLDSTTYQIEPVHYPKNSQVGGYEPISGDLYTKGDIVYHQGSIEDIFGGQASRVSTVVASSEHQIAKELHSDIVNTGIITLLAIIVVSLYSFTHYFYRKNVASILRAPFYSFAENNIIKSLDFNTGRLLTITNLFFFLTTIIAAINLWSQYLGEASRDIISNYISVIIIALVATVILYRAIISSLFKWYTCEIEFFSELKLRNKITSSFLAIIFTPIILLFTFARNIAPLATNIIIFSASFIAIILYIIRVTIYFKAKKVSFLELILYFCIVDLAPVSLFLGVMMRLK